MILALDLGRTVGWARSDGTSGAYDARGDDHGQVLALYADWMEAMVDEVPLTWLAVERGFGGNNASGRLTTAMELTAHAIAWSRAVPRTDKSANEVRKALLGYARVPIKSEPIKAVRVRMLDRAIMEAVIARGFTPANEHAADAAALLVVLEDRPLLDVATGAATS